MPAETTIGLASLSAVRLVSLVERFLWLNSEAAVFEASGWHYLVWEHNFDWTIQFSVIFAPLTPVSVSVIGQFFYTQQTNSQQLSQSAYQDWYRFWLATRSLVVRHG